MGNRIEIPGEPAIEMPSQSTELLNAIFNQLQHLTLAVNTLAGQLDIGLRLASGQMSKHEVKVKYEANDAKIRTEIAAQQAASSE